MKNKLIILLGTLFFGVIVSYIALGWSEPEGSMPSDYASPINTSNKPQDVDNGKPVIVNLDADKVDGYHASDLMAATNAVSGTSTLNIVLAQLAKNNPSLGFPECPAGFTPILQDGFAQYQNQENVIGAYYDAGMCNYFVRASLNGVNMPLYFQLRKNTQIASCSQGSGIQYYNDTGSFFKIPITCVGDCSDCSDAASISLTYSVCARDPLSGTFQGGEVSAPVITSLNSERLISDIPYKGKLKITASINNGGENVTAKLYIDDVLINSQTATASYSYTQEVPESHTSNIKLIVTNSAGTNEKTTNAWVGAIGGGMHTEADCIAAQGEVISIQPGQRTCRFTQSSWTCPSGWSGYYDWSTTQSYTGGYGHFCATGGHTWSNKAQEACHPENEVDWVIFYATILERGCY